MLQVMMDRLCDIPQFSSSWKIYIGERNTGHVSGRHSLIMSRPQYGGRTYSLRDKPDRNYGVWTTAEMKVRFVEHFQAVLADGALVFYEDFVVYNPDEVPLEKYRESVRKTLAGQLRNAVPDRGTGFTGKRDVHGKRIHGQVDDLMMATLMCVYYVKAFTSRKLAYVDYSQFAGTSVARQMPPVPVPVRYAHPHVPKSALSW